MIDLLKKSFIQQKVVEEIKHVNMHLNVPYMSKTDDYTYFLKLFYLLLLLMKKHPSRERVLLQGT
jgi:hypothetical protein